MKSYLPLVVIAVLVLAVALCCVGCKFGGGGSDGPYVRNPLKIKEGELNQIRYTEWDGTGTKYTIFAYPHNDNTIIHETEFSGEEHLYYAKGQGLFEELSQMVNDQCSLDWSYLDSQDVLQVDDLAIELELRVGGRTYKYGTQRMPMDGIEKLHAQRDVIRSYMHPEDEQQPFTVEIGGKTYNTVQGTGALGGTGAVIDFGDELWWEVIGFVGKYQLTPTSQAYADKRFGMTSKNYESAECEITADGHMTVTVDGKVVSNCPLDETYGVGVYASAGSTQFTFYQKDVPEEEWGDFIEIMIPGEPHPVLTPSYDLILERVE